MQHRYIIVPLLFLFAFCNNGEPVVHEVFRLPAGIKEASGIEIVGKTGSIWTHEDHGNDAELFAMDSQGALVNTLVIYGVENNDWEDIAADNKGNLYIGDFGNNDNERKNLCIYKIDGSDLEGSNASAAQTTSFYYPEQKDFPPAKSGKIFDAEAFFVYKDNFYIFSKNRSAPFDGTSNLYRVPNRPGNYAAELIGSFQTCGDYNHCAVTSADISPDGKRIAILTSDHIFVFTDFKKDAFLSGKMSSIELKHYTQKEGLCFKDDQTVYICDERDKKTGGFVYSVKLD